MAEYKGAAKEGARAMALIKKREKMKEDMEALKKKISEVGSNYQSTQRDYVVMN